MVKSTFLCSMYFPPGQNFAGSHSTYSRQCSRYKVVKNCKTLKCTERHHNFIEQLTIKRTLYIKYIPRCPNVGPLCTTTSRFQHTGLLTNQKCTKLPQSYLEHVGDKSTFYTYVKAQILVCFAQRPSMLEIQGC